MRNRIVGVIGILWGGFILVTFFTREPSTNPDPNYQFGLKIGLGFGILMFLAGIYYVIKGDGFPTKKKTKKKSTFRPPAPPPEL